MSETKNMDPEVREEELEAVSGGVSRQAGKKAPCMRCETELPTSALYGGYCKSCYDWLASQGVHIPL